MGAIITWFLRGLTVGGPAAIGYFINDLGGWLARVTGTSDKVVSKDGKGFAPWYIILISIAAGIVLIIGTKMISGRKKLFMLGLLNAVAYGIDYCLFGSNAGFTTASLLFTIAGASTETKSIPFCPEYLVFSSAIVPTQLKVEVVGDGVITSLDGAGITNLNGIRQAGALPAAQYGFQLADGFVNKNTSFTIANPNAGAISIYGFSNSKASMYVKHLMAKSFANATLTLTDDVRYSAFPSAAATDSFTITWSDDTVDTLTRIELVALLAYTQQVSDTRYNLDNYEKVIKRIQFLGAADQTVYYVKFSDFSNVNNAL